MNEVKYVLLPINGSSVPFGDQINSAYNHINQPSNMSPSINVVTHDDIGRMYDILKKDIDITTSAVDQIIKAILKTNQIITSNIPKKHYSIEKNKIK